MKTNKINERPLKKFELGPRCLGFSQQKNSCWNFTIIVTESTTSAFYNDYLAGYIQGKLQGGDMIKASRNNSWNNVYLSEVEHTEKSFPRQLPPNDGELKIAYDALNKNYRYLMNWINSNKTRESHNIFRLFNRMIGVYHGVIDKDICSKIDLQNLIKAKKLFTKDGKLGYGDMPLSFEDIYFINAQLDLWNAISTSKGTPYKIERLDHGTAFLKRTQKDIFWAHNSWCGFLAQSHTINYVVRNGNENDDDRKNIDFISQNSYCPGQIGSNMGYGFNGNGICFNETTHHYLEKKTSAEGIWMFLRAGAAEIFSKSIDDFYNHITLNNAGTYLNGYMLIDVHTRETALIEMSYERFVLFRSRDRDKDYIVTEQRSDGKKVLLTKDDYNPDLLSKWHIFGVNHPVSYNIANDLMTRENCPKRRVQLRNKIRKVLTLSGAKDLITYVEKNEPLSIYGRWDGGYGNAGGYGKVIPNGAIDAKVFSANMVQDLLKKLKFIPNERSTKTSFWMVYGVALMDGKPFTWSRSKWKEYKQPTEKDFVPDVLRGNWFRPKLFID